MIQKRKLLSTEWQALRYHPTQCALWYDTARRFKLVLAGRGSGKTELARRHIVRMLPYRKQWSDPMYFYALPTYMQAKRVAWRRLLKLIPEQWVRNKSESELLIETIFGSSLYVIGMNKPQRAEGVQWDGGIIDESSDQPEGVFDLNFLPAFSHRNAWCWRIGVPKRHGTGAQDFRKACRVAEQEQANGNKAYGYYHWPSADIVPEDILQQAKEALDERDYLEQFEASWQSASGAVYHTFSEDENVSTIAQYNPELPLLIGSDFNVDPMAWVIAQDIPDSDKCYVVDELFIRDTNTRRTLDRLWQKFKDHKKGFVFYGDATGRARKTSASKSDYLLILGDKRFDEHVNKRIVYPKSNPQRTDRYASVNSMLETATGNRRLIINPKCVNLINDLLDCAHEDNAADVGHITDGLGYLIHSRFPLRVKLIDEEGRIIHRQW